MKISDKVVANAMINEEVQFETHERVPFFRILEDSLFQERLIVENFYTITVFDKLYVKMDSTHKNSNGTFSGAEPTYSSETSIERQVVWVTELGEDNLVQSSTLLNLIKQEQMLKELDTAKILFSEKVVLYFKDMSQKGFYSDCLGEVELYESTEDRVKLLTGQALTAAVNTIKRIQNPEAEVSQLAWRKMGETKCYDWSDEAILKCAEDLQQTMQMGQLAMEDLLEAINDATTLEELNAIMVASDIELDI